MTVFENVASLKLEILDEAQFVETAGYYEKGGTGAARYFIKTAAQATSDGDTIDGYGNHSLANGNVAILTSERYTPYMFGLIALDGGAEYHNTAFDAILAFGKAKGGIDLHHTKDFQYFIDRPIQLNGYVNLLGSFKMLHAGLLGFPNNRFINIQPTVSETYDADSNDLTVGQDTINVTGFAGEVGDYMIIMAGDDPYDVNEERYREIVRVEEISGVAITFSPPFPGLVGSPTKDTRVFLLEEPLIGVTIGDVEFFEDNPLKTIDRCVNVLWAIGTTIGNLTSEDHSGTMVIAAEDVDTTIKSIITRKKSTGAAASYGRQFNAWGNKNCKVGTIRGSTETLSNILVESFAEVEMGAVNVATYAGASGTAILINGQSIIKIKRHQNSTPSDSIGLRVNERSTVEIDYVSGVDGCLYTEIGAFAQPPKVVEFVDGTKWQFMGWKTKQSGLVASAANKVRIGYETLVSHVFYSISDPGEITSLFWGNDLSTQAQTVPTTNNEFWIFASTRFGSIYPFNKQDQDMYLQFVTTGSWPSDGLVYITYAAYRKVN